MCPDGTAEEEEEEVAAWPVLAGDGSGDERASSDVYADASISPLGRRAARSRESPRPDFGVPVGWADLGLPVSETRSLLLSLFWRRLCGLSDDSRRSLIGLRCGLIEALGRSSRSPPLGGERCAERPSRDSTCDVVSFAGEAVRPILRVAVTAALGVREGVPRTMISSSAGGAEGPSAQCIARYWSL